MKRSDLWKLRSNLPPNFLVASKRATRSTMILQSTISSTMSAKFSPSLLSPNISYPCWLIRTSHWQSISSFYTRAITFQSWQIWMRRRPNRHSKKPKEMQSLKHRSQSIKCSSLPIHLRSCWLTWFIKWTSFNFIPPYSVLKLPYSTYRGLFLTKIGPVSMST